MRDSRRASRNFSHEVRRMQPAVCIKCGKCLYVVPRRAFRSMRMRIRASSFFFPPFPLFILIHALAIGTMGGGEGGISSRYAIKRNYPRTLPSPSATPDEITVIFFPTTRHTGCLGIIDTHFRDGGVATLEKKIGFQRSTWVCALYAFYPRRLEIF